MSTSAGKHPVRGILAGIAGGLVAAWVMNQFISGVGPELTAAVETEPQRQLADQQKAQDDGQTKEDATMKAADAIVSTVTGGEHLTWEQREKAGPVVHYTFAALMGGLYGGLAEYSPVVRSGFGTTFGSALFAGGDLLTVPALHLGPPATEEPASALATPFAAHLVYGVTVELVRRVVRTLL